MPRREQPHPLVTRLGQRFRELRTEKGYSLEQVSIGAGLRGKGLFSDVEHGHSLPTVYTLMRAAEFLGVDVLDLVNFPERGLRNQLAEVTRSLGDRELKTLLKQATAFRNKRQARPTETGEQ